MAKCDFAFAPLACPHAAPILARPPLLCFPLRCTQTNGSQINQVRAFGDSARLEVFWLVFLTWHVLFLSRRHPCLTVCRLLLRHLFQTADSRSRGAFYFRRRRAWATPATRLSGNAESFAVMPHARLK